jgi:hypothetical protein
MTPVAVALMASPPPAVVGVVALSGASARMTFAGTHFRCQLCISRTCTSSDGMKPS